MVESLVLSTLQILDNSVDPEIKILLQDFNNFWIDYQKQSKLTIAFIGQYNAGKSTLIKALTGDATVRISAEICTDKVTEYTWEDVLIVDTPGIHAGRTDHDQLTLDKISQSDLLVFVVPNELFNPQGGNFFKRVANDLQRVGQMVLVINKMSRETGKPETLLSSILKVIEPSHPNDFYTCFIDGNSYLQAQNESNEEEKLFLMEESNFNEFFNSLQKLIEKNKLTAKLVTPLHKTVDLLEQSSNLLATDNKLVRDFLELLRRKSNILRASQIRSRNIYCDQLNDLEHQIVMSGEQVASIVDGYHNEDQINEAINNSEPEIEQLVKVAIEKISSEIGKEVKNLEAKLQDLEDSLLGKNIVREIEIELQDRKKLKDYNNVNSGNSAYFKAAPKMLKEIGKFAPKATRNFVYNVGTNLGVKFKPWGAFKAAKAIRGLGPVLAGAGFIVDAILADKEKKDEIEFEQKLRELRAEVRKDYRNIAEEIKNDYEVEIEKSIEFYDEELWDLNLKRNQLIENDENKEQILKQINEKLKVIKQEIYNLTHL